jgi:hypothetical protein
MRHRKLGIDDPRRVDEHHLEKDPVRAREVNLDLELVDHLDRVRVRNAGHGHDVRADRLRTECAVE